MEQDGISLLETAIATGVAADLDRAVNKLRDENYAARRNAAWLDFLTAWSQ